MLIDYSLEIANFNLLYRMLQTFTAMLTHYSITFFNEIGITANKSDLNMNFPTNPDDGNEKANLDEYLDVSMTCTTHTILYCTLLCYSRL